MTTDPIDGLRESTAPRLAIAPFYKDDKTGALYVHENLKQVQMPWEDEGHIGPVRAAETFGDVESWARYVEQYSTAPDFPPFLTWNASGLRAVLDYHTAEQPGRAQWIATSPFTPSLEWVAWTRLANGQAHSQREAIDALEDLAPDVVEPSFADLMALLRNLRAAVNATANTELRPDGTTSVVFTSDKTLKSAGDVTLPPSFTIAIPVLKGHVDEAGKPVLYRLPVRLRVSVDDHAHLALRLTMPLAERVREDVFADRVAAAKRLLGDGYSVLRAA